MEIKPEIKVAIRELAKLSLSNLYGKMVSNKDSSFTTISTSQKIFDELKKGEKR